MPWGFHGKDLEGTTLVVQWLGLGDSIAEDMNSFPGRGTNIPHALWCSQKKKKDLQNKLQSLNFIPKLILDFAFCQHH